jgi:hypothetical protein
LEWIRKRVPPTAQSRWIAFASYWGFAKDGPEELAELSDVAAAFGLPANTKQR